MDFHEMSRAFQHTAVYIELSSLLETACIFYAGVNTGVSTQVWAHRCEHTGVKRRSEPRCGGVTPLPRARS